MNNIIINPASYPQSLLKEVISLLNKFMVTHKDDIKKGCKRNYCVLPAAKLRDFLKFNGFPKARMVAGIFAVDDPRPLSPDDFTDEEKELARSQGAYLNNPERAWEFAEKNNLTDELKLVPHYWTQIDDLIIDFTGYEQFVKSGMAADNNIKRYKRKNTTKLKETFDQPYNYTWTEQDNDRGVWGAEFTLADGNKIKFRADVKDLFNDIWVVTFAKYNVTSRSNTFKLTKEGDAFKIFATLYKIIKEFISNVKPNGIRIDSEKEFIDDNTSKEGSRSKLYKIMLNKLGSELSYEVNVSDSLEYTKILLIKKKELKETGDSYYPFKQYKNKPDELGFNFETDDGREVDMTFIATNDNNTDWDVAFDVDSSMGVTGRGDQFKILSTVLKILSSFIESKNPEEFHFTADKAKDISSGEKNTSRSKLYKRAMEVIAKKWGYTLTLDSSDQTVDLFIMTKNKPLTETGDSSYPYKQNRNSPSDLGFNFKTDDDRNVIMIFKATDINNSIWDVAFGVSGEMGVTGKGDQFKILSTIMKILNYFIETKKPEEFRFTADKVKDTSPDERNTSRSKLYKRAMEIMSKKWGYSLTMDTTDNFTDLFILTKNKPLTEEIDSKTLTATVRDKILSYEHKIKSATTSGEVAKIIRQIATSSALAIAKKHNKSMTRSRWIIEVTLVPENQHYGESATSIDDYGLLRLFVSRPITQEYLKDQQSSSPGIADKAFNEYWLGILRFLTHELLHIEQWLRSKGQQINRKSILGKLKTDSSGQVIADNPEAYKIYLSDKLEISAYAMNAVQELQSNGIDIDKLYNNYVKSSISGKLIDYISRNSTSFFIYKNNFWRSDYKNDDKVWNLFLKKFIYHLELRVKK